MKIIIGLGNPGKEYEATRHNVGFIFLDNLQKKWSFPGFESNKKFNAEISKGTVNSRDVILVKPQTFMNLSGEVARAILDFYKLTPEDILVIQDDLDIMIGKYKIATDSSSAGHNGINDLIEKLGTQKFARIRIGIGEEKDGALVCRLGAHDFVLGKFKEEEMGKIGMLKEDILKEADKFATS